MSNSLLLTLSSIFFFNSSILSFILPIFFLLLSNSHLLFFSPLLFNGWGRKQSSETPSPSSSRHHALISPPTNFEHVYHMSPASAGLYLQKEASSQQSLPQLSSSSSSPSTSSLGRVGWHPCSPSPHLCSPHPVLYFPLSPAILISRGQVLIPVLLPCLLLSVWMPWIVQRGCLSADVFCACLLTWLSCWFHIYKQVMLEINYWSQSIIYQSFSQAVREGFSGAPRKLASTLALQLIYT